MRIPRLVGKIAAITASIVVLIAPAVALADANNFTVTDFTADYYLSKDDPQGQMRILEKISVNFTGQNHGILRALPERYKNLPLNIHIDSITSSTNAPTQYTTYEQNGNEVLKIGDASRTVTGEQEYSIAYTMQNVITFYGDHDELYWNTSGLEWMQSFDSITAAVHLPGDLHLSSQMPLCYAGPEGSHDQPCTVTQQGNDITIRTTAGLGPRETMSFVIGFQKGYFTAPGVWDYAAGYISAALQFAVPLVLIGGAGFVWWLKRGRDAKGTGIIIPQYDAPDGLTPLEVGTLIDFKTDGRDLTATVIDLAIRKYVKIVEIESPKLLLLKRKDYRLELLNKDWTALQSWEWELMSGLFGASGQHPQVQLSDLATKLQVSANNAKKKVAQALADKGYFTANPTKYLSLTIGTVVFAVAGVVWTTQLSLQGPLLWGIAAGVIVLAAFYHFMPARTAKGVAADEHIKGLKLYLEVAEKDRIQMMQSPDAPYAPTTGAPEQTVELFEKLLPYAIVLKVEKEWAGKFKDLYSAPPDWYVGNYATFNALYLTSALGGGFSHAVGSTFASAHSASGSGFGGGFAGGGGGGGGGGGW